MHSPVAEVSFPPHKAGQKMLWLALDHTTPAHVLNTPIQSIYVDLQGQQQTRNSTAVGAP